MLDFIPNPTLQSAVADAMDVLSSSGFTALGYIGVNNYIWSHSRNCVVELSANAMSSASTLMAACGSEWCNEFYARTNKDTGAIIGVNIHYLSGEIISSCQKVGVYNPDSIRGSGVWDTPQGLVVNGGTLWSPTIKGPILRSGFEGNIYPASRNIGMSAGDTPATPEELQELDEMLSAYHWGHASDPMLVSGWLSVAILAGAISRRPNLCVTGARGYGKSTAQRVVGDIVSSLGAFGDAQSTPAGIKQRMGSSAGPVIIDEGEDSGDGHIQRLIRMARSTYSDDTTDGILNGSTSGQFKSYAARMTWMLVAINPPALEAADASRWVITEVKGLKKEAQLKPSRLVTDSAYAKVLGKKIRALIVSRYDIYIESLAIIRTEIMSGSAQARQADTIGGLVAGWWILHNDSVPTALQAQAIVAGLDTQAHAEAHSTSDEQDCFSAILRAVLRDGQDTLTVAEAIEKVNTEGAKCRWGLVMGHAGLKVAGSRLHIATSDTHAGVKLLLKDTKFYGGWGRILKRLPDAEHNRSSWIAGVSQKIVSVTYPSREVAGAGEVVDLFDNSVRKIG